jgi:hypothetical protein
MLCELAGIRAGRQSGESARGGSDFHQAFSVRVDKIAEPAMTENMHIAHLQSIRKNAKREFFVDGMHNGQHISRSNHQIRVAGP